MPAAPQFLYDQVPYEGFPITPTHPDRIIPIARLLGLTPTPATRCRVLELGCGDGVNLLPMAATMPESEFVGIDLAVNPIAKANGMAQALGLSNIRFQQMNVMDMDAGFGQFDYILAHGLYSWVPAVVRDRIMSVCQSHLTPNGIAYISYNVYPGCHLRKMMSGMLFFHCQGIDDPVEKVGKAYELLSFLKAGAESSLALTDEVKQLFERRPYSILHDDLSDTNHPVYFHEFAAHASSHGLQFLAESDFFEMQPYNFPQPVQEGLTAFAQGDVVRSEQYLDFLKNRRFRKTLLCRAEIPVNRTPAASALRNLYIASAARAASANPDIASEKEEEFRGVKGGALRTGHRGLKAAIVLLSNFWPEPISFDRLVQGVMPYLDDTSPEGMSLFNDMLLRCFTAGMLELHALPPAFSTSVSERPVAFPFARLQARAGEDKICNLRHTTLDLDPASLHLLTLLDGTQDAESIRRHLVDIGITASPGESVSLQLIEDNLKKMAQAALLVA
jgi:methyltransferase-like protein